MAQTPPVEVPSTLDPDLGNPRPLGDKFYVVQDGNDTALIGLNPSGQAEIPTPSQTLADLFATQFKVVLFDAAARLSDLNKTFSVGTQLMAQRADIPMTTEQVEAPDDADTTLRPGVDSVFKFEPLLRQEDPALMKQYDSARAQAAVTQVDFYSDFVDMIEPLYLGAIARKRRAQWVVDTFCRGIYKDGASAINRNAILNKGLAPLRLHCTQTQVQAQATLHIKKVVAHETEAKTLDRVVQMNQGNPQGTPAAEGTGKTPLVGAAAPGQTAVPPGAMPAIPAPQHPKPTRRGAGPAAPKNKEKSPTRPRVKPGK